MAARSQNLLYQLKVDSLSAREADWHYKTLLIRSPPPKSGLLSVKPVSKYTEGPSLMGPDLMGSAENFIQPLQFPELELRLSYLFFLCVLLGTAFGLFQSQVDAALLDMRCALVQT